MLVLEDYTYLMDEEIFLRRTILITTLQLYHVQPYHLVKRSYYYAQGEETENLLNICTPP